jgi:hypothetical protein
MNVRAAGCWPIMLIDSIVAPNLLIAAATITPTHGSARAGQAGLLGICCEVTVTLSSRFDLYQMDYMCHAWHTLYGALYGICMERFPSPLYTA